MAEVAEEKIRPTTYIIGAIAVIIVLLLVSYLSIFTRGGTWNYLIAESWTQNWWIDFSLVFFMPLVFSAIAALIGPKVRKGELVVILAMVMVTWTFPTYQGILWTTTMLGTARAIPAYQTWTLGYGVEHNWIFGPDPEVAEYWESWMYGGPVLWDVWMPSRLVSIATVLPLLLSYVFLASIWRRMWVDIEVLPYPFATANSELINMAYEKTEKGTPRILANMYLWIGLIIGFLAIYPLWVPDVIPGLGMSKWTDPFLFPPETDLTGYNLIPNAMLPMNFHPYIIAAAFLVPTTTLLSFIVGSFFASVILPSVPVYMGIWEAAVPNIGTNIFRGWTGPMMQTWVSTYGGLMYTCLGAMLGLIYYPLWIHRGEVVDMIKSIFRTVSPEIEKREPIKYRYMWLGYIICVLAYVFMWDFRTYGGQSYGHLPYLGGIIWVVSTGWMYVITKARVEGEMGIVADSINCNLYAHNWNEGVKTWLFADTMSPTFVRDVKERYLILSSDVSWFDQTFRCAPFAYLLSYYKIGSLHGVHAKHIFIGAIISTIIGAIMVPFVSLQFWCMFGATRLPEFAYEGSPGNYFQRGPTYGSTTEIGDYWRGSFIAPPIPMQWVQAAISAIGIIIIYVLRARFAWFPLNPAGVALGIWVPVVLLVPGIVAYVLKLIVLRIGGVKLYEEKLMPFMVGVAAALGLAVVIANLAVSTLPR